MKPTTQKSFTVKQLCELVGGLTNGKGDRLITGISGVQEADEGDVTFVENKRYAAMIKDSKAAAVVVRHDMKVDEDLSDAAFIRVDNPTRAFIIVANAFNSGDSEFEPGIHPTAVIGENVTLGSNVSIQAYAVIGDGASIGSRTVIHPQVFIGADTVIGENCRIYPGVKIRESIDIGNNVIIHSGAVIGSDGFGYATVDGIHHKVPQIGTVQIEDDVEIGANVTIDRARFNKTFIGKGTKIDNLVMIAHNVSIGERCLLIGQSGIAGSSRLGNNCVLAASAGVSGHVDIGDNTIVGGKSGVTKNVPPNMVVSGFPAQEHDKQRREHIYIRKLPEFCARIKDLEERLSQLEETAKNR